MTVPALIIGGGPAGSAAAITLAMAGMRPKLIERHKLPAGCVCGGFLGWDALRALEALGIDPWALGARPISRFRLVTAEQVVEAELPARAAGLSRKMLDRALLDAAQAAGADVTLGRAARAIDPFARSVRLDDGDRIAANAIFLATGKHEMRGLARRFAHSSAGLRASLPSSQRLDGLAEVVELHLFDDGYAGLLMQEDGSANLCLSVSRDRLNEAGSIAALLPDLMRQAPALAARMEGTVPPRFDAVAGVPYGWRARDSSDGIFRIGDQAAVIASLAGDGIAIALASGASAARAMLAGGPGAASGWQRCMDRQSRRPVGIAEMLRHGAASPLPRRAMMAALRLMPRLGTRAARLTRIVRD
ncbi:Monooxygenase FAD-binding protein precursor [Sphingomonas paucimobilis]|nr:Monooxygenase FAD-binding protein precursor [Sphingomonas paucimobilis]